MPTHPCRTIVAALPLALLAACPVAAASARGRVTTEHGIDFVTVGAPGNRNMRTQERYYNNNPSPVTEQVGRVNYRYRVGKTEVTSTQYLQFVRAFGSHWDAMGGNRLSPLFTGGYISPVNFDPSVPTDYFINGGAEVANKAITIDWRVAAYFCNYLNNGAPTIGDPTKETIPWSVFASGAYDSATFVGNPNGPGVLDQAARSPGAKFWIPSLDEWTKAAYYDRQRYAEGNPGPYNGAIPDQQGTGGYWLYPHSSMNEPIIGNPGVGEVGGFEPGSPWPLDVGSYTDVQSPWGVLDMMGSEREWTETVRFLRPDGSHSSSRFTRGSDNGILEDVNDYFFTGDTLGIAVGLRIAATIPAPSTVLSLAMPALIAGARRRRACT